MKAKALLETIKKDYGNEAFDARLVYEDLQSQESIDAFYQSLSRLVSRNELLRVGKGVYCVPKDSPYGSYPPSEHELLAPYLENQKGMVIGYELYSDLLLTTQVAKGVCAYSSAIDSQVKTIGNVRLMKANLKFTPSVKEHVAMMEVLSHLGQIEDFNEEVFTNYIRSFASSYSQTAMDRVLKAIKYKKATIALIKEILDYCEVENSLASYLNPLTKYKLPDVGIAL